MKNVDMADVDEALMGANEFIDYSEHAMF